MNLESTPIRDIAVSFSGEKDGVAVTGTIWAKVQCPVTKKIVDELRDDFLEKARAKGAFIGADSLMLVNVFIAEIE